jgi:hypothetical protein
VLFRYQGQLENHIEKMRNDIESLLYPRGDKSEDCFQVALRIHLNHLDFLTTNQAVSYHISLLFNHLVILPFNLL